MNPLLQLIQALMQGGIGKAAYDILPHTETAPGLRPQSDIATQQLIAALKGGGPGAKAVQSGLRAPGTIAVNQGDPGIMNPLRLLSSLLTSSRGMAEAGTTHPTAQGSEIFLNPTGASKLGADIPSNILPHELIHALRFNKGQDTGNRNIEESLGRMGAGDPLTSYLYRQFDEPSQAPMSLEDQGMLQRLLAETLASP
jgi:hypothetical protein